METIKIAVEVNVNLSENTQKFLTGLFSCNGPVPTIQTAPAAKPAPAPEAPKPQAPTAQAAAPAQAKPAAAPAPSVPVAQDVSSASRTIEEVRKLLAAKVNDHRDAIKQKLNSLGAPSVSKLDPGKYSEMYDFLNAL